MNGLLGTLLPLALAVAICPLPIAAEIVLLFTARPIANATAFMVGFVAGVAVIVTVLVLVANALNLNDSGPSKGAATVQLVLGIGLLIAAVRRFRTRPRPGSAAEPPRWMSGMNKFTTGRSLAVGAGLGAFNPKNIVIDVAAAAAISTAGLGTAKSVVAVVVFFAISSIGVVAPLVVTAVAGDRAQPVLTSWREWLEVNNATVLAVIFLVFGVVLIGRGVAGI